MTVSNGRPISADGTPDATDAFMIRAPSRCRLSSSSRAVATTASISAGRQNAPARRVVGVLDRDDPRAGRVRRVAGADRLADLLGREAARLAAERPRHQAGEHRRPAELGDEDVRVLLGDDLLARLGERAQRDLVRHRRRRDEDRLLLPEQLRRAALELVHGRVLAPLLVADLGRGDRGAHLRASAASWCPSGGRSSRAFRRLDGGLGLRRRGRDGPRSRSARPPASPPSPRRAARPACVRRLLQHLRAARPPRARSRASRRRTRRASPSPRSRSARSSAPPGRRAGSRSSAGGSRSPSAASRRRAR